MANLHSLMNESAAQLGGSPMSLQAEEVACAETDGMTLFYNSGFMSGLESAAGTDGVRFVIAHELGHQVGGMGVGGHAGEFMADEYAARALAEAGGDFSAVVSVFNFLGESSAETHPSNSSRIERARQVYNSARGEIDGGAGGKKVADRAHERDLAI